MGLDGAAAAGLHIAALLQQPDWLHWIATSNLLLASPGMMDCPSLSQYGATVLLAAAEFSSPGNLTMVDLLLERGADLTKTQGEGVRGRLRLPQGRLYAGLPLLLLGGASSQHVLPVC